LFGVPPAAIEYQAAGVNHLPWVLRLRVNGQDGFDLLRERLAAHGTHEGVRDLPETSSVESVFIDRSAVKLSLFQLYGYLPGAGDRHLAEFFPAFLPRGC
jgi:alpha-galactosidase